MQSVRIPKAICDSMIAHAREGFPNEVCGIIMGPPGEMREIHRAKNAAADPLYAYDIDGQDLLRLNELADDKNWDFVAIYHSHPPFAEVYPSATDIARAFYPDAVYIILAIGRVAAPFREQLRDPARRANALSQFGDPQTLPPRLRAYRIIKEDVFRKEGRVEELEVSIR
jgi:proteasome lid subunit RPN8/RPN11